MISSRTFFLTLYVHALFIITALHAGEPASDSLSATTITLQGELPLDRVLRTLSQTGNEVIDFRSRLGQEVRPIQITADLRDVPFWKAADNLMAAAKLRLVPLMDQRANKAVIAITEPEIPQTAPVAYSGPFRVALTKLTEQSRVEGNPQQGLLATVELAWEPRLLPLLLKAKPESFGYQAAHQKAVVIPQPAGSYRLLGEYPFQYPMRFSLPSSDVRELSALRGVFEVLVPPRGTTLEMKAPSIGKTAESDGVQVTVAQLRTDNGSDQLELSLRLRYPQGSLDLESYQTWFADALDLTITNRDGRPLRSQGLAQISIDEGRFIQMTYFYENPKSALSDLTLKFRVPAPPVKVPVAFEFKNVALP